MIILGIDPGSQVTGYGVVRCTQGRQTYVASGCIRTTKGQLNERLLAISDALEQILRQYQPNECAIEQVFVHANVKSALTLGHARGVAMLCLARHSLTLGEYSPREIKLATVGYGNATKQQMQDMVRVLLQLNKAPPSDAADALAVALCHAQRRHSRIAQHLSALEDTT